MNFLKIVWGFIGVMYGILVAAVFSSPFVFLAHYLFDSQIITVIIFLVFFIPLAIALIKFGLEVMLDL